MTLAKTGLGQQAMKDRSVPLTARQRAAFILFDGKRSRADVLTSTAGMGVTADDIDYLLGSGMLAEAVPASAVPPPMTAAPAPEAGAPSSNLTFDQERYQRAYVIATRITAGLGLRGFRLNLAVEAAGSYAQLLELAPKIRDAVGEEKFRPLGEALSD